MTPDKANHIVNAYRSSPAYPVAGEPFGYSVVMFQARIEQRLIDRGMRPIEAYFRSRRVYERVMKYRPSFREYCKACEVLQRADVLTLTHMLCFTPQELHHMVDAWQMANDPVSKSIADKAALMLSTQMEQPT